MGRQTEEIEVVLASYEREIFPSVFADKSGWQSYSGVQFFNLKNTSDDPDSSTYHGEYGMAIMPWKIPLPTDDGYEEPIVIATINGERIKSIKFDGPFLGNWYGDSGYFRAYRYRSETPLTDFDADPRDYIENTAIKVYQELLYHPDPEKVEAHMPLFCYDGGAEPIFIPENSDTVFRQKCWS